MKHSRLHGVAHNYADSLAAGLSFVVPNKIIQTHVFTEAAANEAGFIVADFLTGEVNGARHEGGVESALPLFRNAFPEFCEKHKVEFSDYAAFLVRFISDKTGKSYVITIQDRNGKRTSRKYVGYYEKRGKALDHFGTHHLKYLNAPLD